MRYYEWKQYRDNTIKPVLLKCSTHELFGEISGLMVDIDRSYRLIGYTKIGNKRILKKRKNRVPYYNRRELDQKWLIHDITSKIAYLQDMLLMMKLGS